MPHPQFSQSSLPSETFIMPERDHAPSPILPVIVALGILSHARALPLAEQRGNRQSYHRHELDQDVQGRSRGVLEGIPHGVAHNARLALIGLLDLQLLAELL